MLRLELVLGRVEVVVPDDVHDPHPAGQRVGVAVGVGGEGGGEEGLGALAVGGLVGVQGPVDRAAVLVLGGAASRSRAGSPHRRLPPYVATSHSPSATVPARASWCSVVCGSYDA